MEYDINQIAVNAIDAFEGPVNLRYVHDAEREELEAHGDICSLLTSLAYMTDKLIAAVDDDADETEEDRRIAKQVCFSQVFILLAGSAKHVGYPMGALREIIDRIERDKDD